jgi:hypothetical protein
MTDFRDPFPNLAQVVDIGGDRYFMGPQKPIELGFKSRADFINSFGKDTRTEYLLRKYMLYSLKGKEKLTFEDPSEKTELIALLKKRAKQLESSKEFTSSTLKNTLIQRSFINIQRLIQQLEGPEYKGTDFSKYLPDISLPCTKAKKYVKEIPEERLFQLILEIAWYLLHPDDVPKKVQCNWAAAIKGLDTLRLGDIIAQIKTVQEQNGTQSDEKPFNYFKRINIDKISKASSRQNALDEAKQMALQIQDGNINKKMKERLKTLIDILEIRKYLNNDLPLDTDRMKIIDTTAGEKIKKSLISNPMRGGAAKALDKPLGLAMRPFFDYFRVIFDPIYSIIESSFKVYSARDDKIKKVVIPQLTTILNICNNLNPGETANGGQNTYGIYRIKNMDNEIIQFVNTMLNQTQTYLEKFGADDSQKNLFNRQLFHLPKVRLSTLLHKFVNEQQFQDPEFIPYIQFFTVGGNMNFIPKEKFLNPAKPEMNEDVFNAVSDFFKPTDLYIICTKSENVIENIPMNMYEINFEDVDVGEKGLKIDNIPSNYFNKLENKKSDLYFENLMTLSPYVIFNDAELALSIFAAFKELMPN